MGYYVDFLKECDLFYNLTSTQLEMIESICEEINYKKGDLIFEENSREKELYLILQGEVEIIIQPALSTPQNPNKNNRRLALLQRTQSFGEIALVDEGMRSAGVLAASKKVDLLMVNRDHLLKLCSTYPEMGYKIMYNLAADLAQKIRNSGFRYRETFLYGNINA